MLAWLIALAAGAAFATLGYAGRGRPTGPAAIAFALAALARLVAVTLAVALLLDAPRGAARPQAPLVALDVSASWRRGGDSTAWRRALAAADSAGGATVRVGEMVEDGPPPAEPQAPASRLEAVVDRAAVDGRPLVLVTDGEADAAVDASRLAAGSRVTVVRPVPAADVGVASLDAPRAAVAEDSIEIAVGLAAGEAAGGAGTLRLLLDGAVLDSVAVPALAAWESRRVARALRVPVTDGARTLAAVWRADGTDAEGRNDTLRTALDVTALPRAVFVSTAPDADARWLEGALRAATGPATRTYWRVAAGTWREGATYRPVDEAVVRRAVAAAPIAVVHGDTALFGALPGARLLATPAGEADGEWYPAAGADSPLAGAIATAPFDSVPPLAVGTAPPLEFTVLSARLGRRGEARPVLTGTAGPPRRLVLAASGFSRWKLLGGAPADAFDVLAGAAMAWLADAAPDRRAVVPSATAWREGEPQRWRRTSADTLVAVAWRRVGGGAVTDTVRLADTLVFAGGAVEASFGRALPVGVWDAAVPGGTVRAVVNPSAEWVPRRPLLASGPVGEATAGTVVPRTRTATWLFAVVVLLLSAEWILRRRAGLR